MDATPGQPVPDARSFRHAFQAIRPSITPAQHRMLKAHCLAEGHQRTSAQLAEAAGYAVYRAANLQYGLLGKALGQHLGFTPEMRHRGGPVWINVLATGAYPPESSDPQHFIWTMRTEVVGALLNLPWGILPPADEAGSV